MRDSLVFYRSFSKAIKRLPEADQLKALWAIIDYGLDGTEPEEDGLYMVAYEMAKPQIDANIKRKINGSKGGRPSETNGYEKEKPMVIETENHRLSETETNGYEVEKPNVNENVNVKENNKRDICAPDDVQDPEEVNTEPADGNLGPIAKAANALFEELWAAYPQKRGKGSVSDLDKKKLLKIGREHMMRAMNRYIAECNDQGRYYKNGSTFFHSGYIDYLDDNYTKPAEKPKPQAQTKNRFQNFENRGYDYDSAIWADIRRQHGKVEGSSVAAGTSGPDAGRT